MHSIRRSISLFPGPFIPTRARNYGTLQHTLAVVEPHTWVVSNCKHVNFFLQLYLPTALLCLLPTLLVFKTQPRGFFGWVFFRWLFCFFFCFLGFFYSRYLHTLGYNWSLLLRSERAWGLNQQGAGRVTPPQKPQRHHRAKQAELEPCAHCWKAFSSLFPRQKQD